MAEATLYPTFQDLYEEVCWLWQNTRAPAAGAVTEAKAVANNGLRAFYGAHDWYFLETDATLSVWPTTTTGAVTTGGVGDTQLTSATACFYPSMVGKTIVSDTLGTSYTIVTYTSSTVVVVSADASADDGDTFTITANGDYRLPIDFGEIRSTFAHAVASGYGTLREATPEWIRARRAEASVSGPPTRWAISAAYAQATGQHFNAMLWPTPGSVYVLGYQYTIEVPLLTVDAEYPAGGAMHGDTILAFVRREYETHFLHKIGAYATLAEQALARSIARDARQRPANLGPSENHADDVRDVPSPGVDRTNGVTMT